MNSMESVYNCDDIVYVDGIDEFKSKIIDKKFQNNNWIYIIQYLNYDYLGIKTEERLYENIL